MAFIRKPTNYLAHIKHIFPNIIGIGVCYGHSHMAIPALIEQDLGTFIKRLTAIYYGPFSPNDLTKRITLVDLKEFIQKNRLDIAEDKIEEQAEVKQHAAENRETTVLPWMVACGKLTEELKKEPIPLPPDLTELFSPSPNDSLGEFLDIPLQSPSELKAIIDLTWKINEKMRESDSNFSFLPEVREIETFFLMLR